jgi:hypothetical protein
MKIAYLLVGLLSCGMLTGCLDVFQFVEVRQESMVVVNKYSLSKMLDIMSESFKGFGDGLSAGLSEIQPPELNSDNENNTSESIDADADEPVNSEESPVVPAPASTSESSGFNLQTIKSQFATRLGTRKADIQVIDSMMDKSVVMTYVVSRQNPSEFKDFDFCPERKESKIIIRLGEGGEFEKMKATGGSDNSMAMAMFAQAKYRLLVRPLPGQKVTSVKMASSNTNIPIDFMDLKRECLVEIPLLFWMAGDEKMALEVNLISLGK